MPILFLLYFWFSTKPSTQNTGGSQLWQEIRITCELSQRTSVDNHPDQIQGISGSGPGHQVFIYYFLGSPGDSEIQPTLRAPVAESGHICWLTDEALLLPQALVPSVLLGTDGRSRAACIRRAAGPHPHGPAPPRARTPTGPLSPSAQV